MRSYKVSDSKTIDQFAFDLETKELLVAFHTGAIYVYHDVSGIDVLGMAFSKSVGEYFTKHIKHRYEYEKLA